MELSRFKKLKVGDELWIEKVIYNPDVWLTHKSTAWFHAKVVGFDGDLLFTELVETTGDESFDKDIIFDYGANLNRIEDYNEEKLPWT